MFLPYRPACLQMGLPTLLTYTVQYTWMVLGCKISGVLLHTKYSL